MSGPDCDECGKVNNPDTMPTTPLKITGNFPFETRAEGIGIVVKLRPKWTKFKDGLPLDPTYQTPTYIYITNYVSCWRESRMLPRGWEQFAIENPNYAWAEIPLPEVPKEPKEAHHCAKGQFSTHESPKDNTLALKFQNDSFTYYCFIDHCPFCGYKAKE